VRAEDSDTSLDFVVAGNERNLANVHTARGHADFTFERISDGATDPTSSSRKMHLSTGIEHRKIAWFADGDKRRTDELSVDIPAGKERYGVPMQRETCWTADEQHYLVHFVGSNRSPEAYLNQPLPKRMEFVRNSIARFDPMLFFKVDDSALNDWLAKLHSAHFPFKVTAKGSGDSESYVISGEEGAGASSKRFEIQIDGGSGFNVIKMRTYNSAVGESPILAFDATYTDGGTEKAAFFPSEYHLRVRLPDGTESVDVNFSDVILNQPIDPKTFTFEGIGVPKGTVLVDMRTSKPTRSYYGGLPSKALDDLVDDVERSKTQSQGGGTVASSTFHQWLAGWRLAILSVVSVAIIVLAGVSLLLAKRTRQARP